MKRPIVGSLSKTVLPHFPGPGGGPGLLFMPERKVCAIFQIAGLPGTEHFGRLPIFD